MRSSITRESAEDPLWTSPHPSEEEVKTEDRPPTINEDAAAASVGQEPGRIEQAAISETGRSPTTNLTRGTRESGPGNLTTSNSEPVATLSTVVQQLLCTINRLEARIDELETAPALDGNAVTTATPRIDDATTPAATTAAQRVGHASATTATGGGGTAAGQRQTEEAAGHCRTEVAAVTTAPSPRRRHHRKNAKDLELTPYKSSPTVSVSTWIAKVALVEEGARVSGRGNWTDEELYFVVGNKVQDNAASWWYQMDQKLPNVVKTWTRLKAALMRRYGERPDQAMAEWRVFQRMMYPGETFSTSQLDYVT
ncbi:hypothetical protein PR001_g23260 [Phytophthora rubi]|uniref:Retrotransposon gag domain-containing protein n=1 Tax=Phytophthora rubi TaxID=129364 RepID=A0A6A3IUT7_9STRA|nr:hypothetical protein PR001_g23260 [Phytophthora rubi]